MKLTRGQKASVISAYAEHTQFELMKIRGSIKKKYSCKTYASPSASCLLPINDIFFSVTIFYCSLGQRMSNIRCKHINSFM